MYYIQTIIILTNFNYTIIILLHPLLILSRLFIRHRRYLFMSYPNFICYKRGEKNIFPIYSPFTLKNDTRTVLSNTLHDDTLHNYTLHITHRVPFSTSIIKTSRIISLYHNVRFWVERGIFYIFCLFTAMIYVFSYLYLRPEYL